MPALDPFSAASRPMLPFDTLPSRPLPFAATLHPIDLNDAHNLSLQKLPKARRHREPAPKSFPLPQYRQSPLTSMALHQNGVNPVVVGSDEWMQAEIARCVDSAKGDLDISWVPTIFEFCSDVTSKKGLKVLSTKIIDLRDLVTLPTSFSPLASTFSRRGPTSESSPLLHNPQPSPGSGHLSANARAFSRTTSAPASVAVFTTTHSQRQQRSSDRGRAVSGPSHREFRLHSPTPTETSEDEMEESNADAREVTSSPSLPAPSNTETHMQGLRTRAFGRSKTGAVSFNPNMASGKGRLAAMDISIYAASNYLTS